jgi:alpha-mannosidase
MVSRIICFLIFTVLSVPSVLFGQSDDQVRINIRQAQDTMGQSDPRTFLNGYRKSLSGERIAYRSSHPDAGMALLVRARKEAHAISWETDVIPEAYSGDRYRFIWVAGLERQGFQNPEETHSFDFLVNGQRWFRFQNRKDSSARFWTIRSENGAELSFDATTVDRVGDLFGTMHLDVPRQLVPAGKPLIIQVIGEDAESGDWYMAFEYSYSFEPRIRPEPVLVKKPGKPDQLLRVSLDNLRKGRSIDIWVGNLEMVSRSLEIGSNIFYVPIPAVSATREIPLVITLNDKPESRRYVPIKPVNKREIYILSYSHNDIGYTDLQPNIEKKQWRNLDEALRLIALTKDYPEGSRYKWNMEVLWSLESYLKQATDSKRREVMQAVKAGSVGLNALYANILTGLANSVEMTHFTDFARTLDTSWSLAITSALVSDIPGFTWGIVPTLAQSGVKYFSISPNPGDRIGYTIEQWGDKPFYWKSQSGKERILTWVAGESYASFHEGDLSKLGDEKLFKLFRKLDEKKYPYEILQLPYTVGGDNGPPDPNLSDFVKKWNERYATPRLIIATHEEMFREFERRYGASLPSVAGDFTPYWEDGAASSAYETSLNRQASDRLIQNQALWSMRSPASFPDTEFAAAWRNVIFYDEHTWGAYNSISEPDAPLVKNQWAIKRQFAVSADSISRMVGPEIRVDEGIEVYNTQSWSRSDVVRIPGPESQAGERVVDVQGNQIPSQRLSTGELAVLVKDLQPLSARRIIVKKGAAYAPGTLEASGNMLGNNLFTLTLNKSTGAIDMLTWKRNGLQLVDGTRGGLNTFLYVSGTDPGNAKTVSNVKISVKERGKLMSSLLVTADAPGCRNYSYEVTVYDGIDRVDITNWIDKEPIRAKEGVHISFPFNVPEGQVRYNVGFGVVRPELDQLPGACKNFFSIESWVDISDDQRGVTWASVDAPLIEIGTITAEKPWLEESKPAQNLYSYVMNNYWHTNYKADQEGEVLFRYSLRPHGGYQQEEAARFGLERRQPLIVVPGPALANQEKPLFSLEGQRVIALETRPVPGGWLVLLYNPTDEPESVKVAWNDQIPVTKHLSDSFGTIGEELRGAVQFAPHQNIYIRIVRR